MKQTNYLFLLTFLILILNFNIVLAWTNIDGNKTSFETGTLISNTDLNWTLSGTFVMNPDANAIHGNNVLALQTGSGNLTATITPKDYFYSWFYMATSTYSGYMSIQKSDSTHLCIISPNNGTSGKWNDFYASNWHELPDQVEAPLANNWYLLKSQYDSGAAKCNFWVYKKDGTYVGGGLNRTINASGTPAKINLNQSQTSLFWDAIAITNASYTALTFPLTDTIPGVIASDFNFSFDVNSNILTLISAATIDVNYTIIDWNWLVNNSTNNIGNSDANQTTYSPITQNLDYNVCLSVGGWQDSNHTNLIYAITCKSIVAWDTIAPTIDVNIVYVPGFVTNLDINYSMRCSDNSSNITYQVIKNDVNYVYNSLDLNNSLKTGTVTLLPASSTQITFKCIDSIGNTSSYQTTQLYALLFRLVNEQTGANVSVSDINSWLTSALVYTYDGNYSFDFNGSGVTTKTFLSPGTEVRFDFVYRNSTVTIGRDIDFSLISDQNIPICLAPPQTFYVQTIYSATEKPVILYSESTRCYNLISNTKFALENGLMARAYTIPKPYLLKTIIGGITTTLTSVDGGLENTINIDSLQFNQSALDIKIGQDVISFGKDLNYYNIMKFLYQNPNDDSTSTTLVIKNGSTTLFSYTENITPNEFVANWNYVDFNLDQNAILNMTVSKTIGGVVESYTFYFTLGATYYQGSVNEWFALIVAFCLVLFGMTLVAYKHSFGWFGLIMLCAALLILALAPGYWYVRFFQGILLILIIFVGLIFKNETQGAV